jgi:hypothetical protein
MNNNVGLRCLIPVTTDDVREQLEAQAVVEKGLVLLHLRCRLLLI